MGDTSDGTPSKRFKVSTGVTSDCPSQDNLDNSSAAQPAPWTKESKVYGSITIPLPDGSLSSWLKKYSAGCKYQLRANWKKGSTSLILEFCCPEDYDHLASVLLAQEEGFHTYMPKDRRQFRSVLGHIPPTVTEDEVLADLLDQGLPAPSMLRRLPGRNNSESGYFLVGWNSTPADYKKITYVCGLKIKWEPPRSKPRGVPLCQNCGRLYHLKSGCGYPQRCLQCGTTGHSANSCSKQPLCLNCPPSDAGDNKHPTLALSCPTRVRLAKRPPPAPPAGRPSYTSSQASSSAVRSANSSRHPQDLSRPSRDPSRHPRDSSRPPRDRSAPVDRIPVRNSQSHLSGYPPLPNSDPPRPKVSSRDPRTIPTSHGSTRNNKPSYANAAAVLEDSASSDDRRSVHSDSHPARKSTKSSSSSTLQPEVGQKPTKKDSKSSRQDSSRASTSTSPEFTESPLVQPLNQLPTSLKEALQLINNNPSLIHPSYNKINLITDFIRLYHVSHTRSEDDFVRHATYLLLAIFHGC